LKKLLLFFSKEVTSSMWLFFALVVVSVDELKVQELQNNSTITLHGLGGGEWTGVLSEEDIPVFNHIAPLKVLSGLLSPAECRTVIDKLSTWAFDSDEDSVDGARTFEFYLEKNGSTGDALRYPGKPDDDPSILEARRPVRDEIASILRPVVLEWLEPFINEHFKHDCNGKCRACYSLIRRYREWERRDHKAHFDIQALVTVVVSLNSFGRDFKGGIYVLKGVKEERQFIALQEGDAVIHQSDLLHGVRVFGSAERWSWILWFQDSSTCNAEPETWNRKAAEEGDAVAQFLVANRAGMASSGLKWLKKAARGGYSRAQNDLGMLFKNGFAQDADLDKALFWLRKSAKSGSPTGMYNLGEMLRQQGKIEKACYWFEKSALLGQQDSAHNMGIAYHKGVGGRHQDNDEAVRWLELSGNADSLYAAFLISEGPQANEYLIKAAKMGHIEAQQKLDELYAHLHQKAELR